MNEKENSKSLFLLKMKGNKEADSIVLLVFNCACF